MNVAGGGEKRDKELEIERERNKLFTYFPGFYQSFFFLVLLHFILFSRSFTNTTYFPALFLIDLILPRVAASISPVVFLMLRNLSV